MTSASRQPGPGRVLALDLGTRRIGVAVSDELRVSVRPLGTIRSAGPRRDAAAVRALVGELEVALLVIGLPLLPSGDEGASAVRVRSTGEVLARRLGLPATFVDESLSTVEAEERLAGRKRSSRAGRNRAGREGLDAHAAAVILEAFLASEERASTAVADEHS